MTSATPDRFSKRRPSIGPGFPVIPMAVRVAPGIGCARKPIASTILTTASTSRAVALAFITINIFLTKVGLVSLGRDKSPLWRRERNQRPLRNGRFLSPDYERRRENNRAAIYSLFPTMNFSAHSQVL